MDAHVWWAFFAASWLISISPGSAAVLSLGHGLAHGVRHTSVTIAGMGLGLALVLLVAGAGVGALLLASSVAFTVVKVLGATYLIWLGWQQWRTPVSIDALQSDASVAAVARARLPSARERFATGFLTNATNPKGIVFMVAVLPQFINPHRPLWLQLLLLLVTAVSVEVLVMHGYAALASRAQRWLSTARARVAQNRVFGGVLMAMGASLLMVKRAAG
ncbi:LysE family transporter [Hydrogenophaga sp.]|uniref:LysE family transporter n=1 Tax=Hydrogenophaga sp. TaxID=1904254 RepID=UPI002621EC40|nr:LysE family transporter [Hydrogenophaga sp.]MDM7951004.1 LysE family transporter [Hydrogenophaga sp.]